MIDKWVRIRKEEQTLAEREADILRDKAQFERLEDEYIDYFTKAGHLFDDLRFKFCQTNEAHIYEEISYDIHRDSNGVFETLISLRESLDDKHQIVQTKIDEVSEEKQKILRQEEENHEY